MKILHTILCDDVRDEANGKQTLVGVYNDSIGVPQLPYQFYKLYIRMVILDFEGGDENLSLELKAPSGRIVYSLRGPILEDFKKGHVDQSTLVIEMGPILFDEEGIFVLYQIKNNGPKELYSFKLFRQK